MIFILWILTLPHVYSNEIDFLHSRGITIRNLTWIDGAFYSGIDSKEIHIRMPIPKIPADFRFQNGCANIDKSMAGNLNTTEYNSLLAYVIDSHLKNLFYPDEEPDRIQKPPQPVNEDDDLSYLPKDLFAVNLSSKLHGIPREILRPDIKPPSHIVASGIGKFNKVSALGDNSTNTYISFRCDRERNPYLRFMINHPTQSIIIVTKSAPNALDFQPKFRLIDTKAQGQVKSMSDDLCQRTLHFGRGKQIQAFVMNCGILAKYEPAQVLLSIDFGEKCESIRMAEIGLLPAANSEKLRWSQSSHLKRRRRQFGEFLAIAGLATGLSSWGSSWLWHSEDTSKIQNLKKDTELAIAHEEDFDKAFNKDLQDTALVNSYTEKLVDTVHHELCAFETEQETVKLQDFIDKLAWKFIEEVEATLTHATIPIDGNSAQKAAIQLCRSRNDDNVQYLCMDFYTKNKDNYQIQAVRYERDSEGVQITGAVISVSVKIPKFLPSDLMTIHKVMKVPIPLFVDDDNLYHFAEYLDLPELFGTFPALNRRIALTNCKLYDSTYFCPSNLLNRLYSSESTCLNTIFSTKPSCKRRLIRSYASCIADSDKDILLLSHIGSVGITAYSDNSAWKNVQKYDSENSIAIKSSNISIISGEAALNIRCKKSQFYYAGNSPVITSFLQLENTTEDFPAMHSNLEGMESLKLTDETYDKLFNQMEHVQDDVLRDQIRIKKIQNDPDYMRHSPFSDETTSKLTDWVVPVLSVISTISVLCGSYCCIQKCLKCTSCCPESNCKNEYKIAKQRLCVKEMPFDEPVPIATVSREYPLPMPRRTQTTAI